MAEPIKLHPKRTQEPVAKETATGSCHGHAGHDHAEHTQTMVPDRLLGAEHRVKDPVCGMGVDPHTAKHRAEHEGQTYYFCSAGCRTKFIADPRRYLDAASSRARRAGARRHDLHLPDASGDPAGRAGLLPDLRHGAGAGAGRRADAGPNPELVDMTRRFWIGLALTLPVVRAGDGRASDRARPSASASSASNWLQLAAGDAGRAVGRLAVLRARLAVAASRATSTCSR